MEERGAILFFVPDTTRDIVEKYFSNSIAPVRSRGGSLVESKLVPEGLYQKYQDESSSLEMCVNINMNS
jgi:hypothetical protein